MEISWIRSFGFGWILVCLILPLQASTTATVDAFYAQLTNDRLVDWAVMVGAPEYRSVIAEGPNALPRLFEHYSANQDLSIKRALDYCIWAVSGACTVYYSDTKGKRDAMGNPLDKPAKLPVMAILHDNLRPGSPEHEAQVRTQWLEWWRLRNTFILHPESLERLERITAGMEKTTTVSKEILREHRIEMVNGIYILPAVIRMSVERNSAPAFHEFLRYVPSGILEKFKTSQWESRYIMVHEKFPTTQSKREVIKAWWERDESKYVLLPELHQAIEAEVKRVQVTEGITE